MAGDIISFPGRSPPEPERGVSYLIQKAVDAHEDNLAISTLIRAFIDPGIGPSEAAPRQVTAIVSELIGALSQSMANSGELRVQASTIYQPELSPKQNQSFAPGHYLLLLLDAKGTTNFAEDFALEVGLQERVAALAGKLDVSVTSASQLSVALHLPLIPQEAPSAAPESTHILLVDDNEEVLASVSEMLKQLGYRVTTRSGAADALDTLGRDPDDFQLLLSDITMPRVSGVEMVARLQIIRSDLPVVFMTGFSTAQNTARSPSVRAMLIKPFTLAELKAAIAQALSS